MSSLFWIPLANFVKEWYNQTILVEMGDFMTFQNWLRQLDYESLLTSVLIVAAALLCIMIHEICHGLAAYALGDPTAKRAGRLSFNPIRHIDIAGLILMAVMHFGWAKAVPVNPRNFKHPKRDMALTALAGPLSNVVLAAVALLFYNVAFFFYLYLEGNEILRYVAIFFSYTATMSAGLAVFNIFPIPPLDGSKILFSVLPDEAYNKLLRYERYGMLLLGVLLIANVVDGPLLFLRQGLMNGLDAICTWPFDLLCQILL